MDTSKIIKGVVGGGRYTVTAPIVKEDYGLYLQIEGVELPSTYEVDFSNSENSGTSVTMIGNSDGVLIPSQFISSGKDVFAFLYHVGEDFGRTVYKFRIPNKVRPDRTNEEPTPEEQSVIDQAISVLNTAVAQTAEDVESADQSAQSAREDADRAERAKTSAETAQGKAEDAQESAERAKDDAETSERNASESEQKAKGYAETASAKADAITGLTATATTLPDGSSATASYDAETGVMSFGIPKGKDGRDGTDGDDGYSPTASVTKSGKVATITITDKNGTTSAQVSDGEDGTTGATPNLTIGTVETLESDESATATITGTPENPVLNLGIPQGDTGEVTLEEFYKAFPTDTASGAVASFSDGADDIPLKSLIVNIDPVQDLSNGDPSPENICPITGWTGMQLTQANENLIPESLPDNVISGTASNGKIASASNAKIFAFPIPKNTPLHIQKTYGDASSGNIGFLENGEPQVGDAWINNKGFTNVINQDYTANEYSWMGIQSYNLAYAEAWFTTRELMVSVGNTRKDYVAPKGYSTRHISWETEAGTVYGGRLDVLTGKLTVYPYYASYNGETLTGEWISDRDVYAVGTTPTIGAQVVNIGAQGTEYQLEPHDIASLLGQNNIWADTGDTSIEYRADTKLYINRLTEPDADMIADSNITSGQYFMVGNNLFKATANIANGGQIIVGTNATRVSLAQALNEINA